MSLKSIMSDSYKLDDSFISPILYYEGKINLKTGPLYTFYLKTNCKVDSL